MDKMVEVKFRNQDPKKYLEGTPLIEVSSTYQKYYNYPILVAMVGNDIAELSDEIFDNCHVDFFDRSSAVGNNIYGRSLQFILVLAIKRLFGKDQDILIEHSIDKGFYCEIPDFEIDKETLKNLEKAMKEIVKENLKFDKLSITRTDAIKYFTRHKQKDKVRVLNYISNSYVNIYRLDDIYDYYYGPLAFATSQIDEFKLNYVNPRGFVVSYPSTSNPEYILDYVHHEKIFDKFLEYTDWGRRMNVSKGCDLNDLTTTGKYGNLIRLAEAYFNMQLGQLTEEIYSKRKNIKVVLLAGPTSSGKTTTAKKLELFLNARGVKTHHISIDDYFFGRDKTPKTKDGGYDFESIKAIDVNLFNRDLAKALSGKKVQLPEYDFKAGKRIHRKRYLEVEPEDIIIVEGLHALNDDLTMTVERKYKFKIYVSPLTQINIDNHNWVHTTDVRKLRRIVRDNQYRNWNATDTLGMWDKIRQSEEKYIFTFQDDTDAVINSALIYEIGVLKTFVEPLLFSVSEKDESYPEALRLINLLRIFLPIPTDDIPQDSVLREFIGNSCFK